MDELFEFHNHNSLTYSKSELYKTEDGIGMDILLPGFKKEEVTVDLKGKELIIEAATERKLPRYLNHKVRKTYQVEEVDPESIKAVLENGILTLTFKTPSKNVGRKIAVS
jgi:HSP20 family protein